MKIIFRKKSRKKENKPKWCLQRHMITLFPETESDIRCRVKIHIIKISSVD